MDPTQQQFELEDLVRDSVGPLAPQMREKGVELTSAMDPGVPLRVIGHRSPLLLVLNDLLNHVVRSPRGEIAVRVSLASADPVDPARCLLRFSIRDTGLRLSRHEVDSLFKHGSQGSASSGENTGGSALDLVDSRQMVELMGGEIGVNTAVDAGSEFWFTVDFGLPDDRVEQHLQPQPGAVERSPDPAEHRTGQPDAAAPELWDLSGMMDRLMGDEELIHEVLQEFLLDLPHQVEQLQQLIFAEDRDKISRQAHLIKGMAANAGAEALRVRALDLERMKDAGDVKNIRSQAATMQALSEQTQAVIRRHMGGA